MQEKEFKRVQKTNGKLMEKSIEGSLTDKEQECLAEFEKGLDSTIDKPHFQDESHKIHLKESIWIGISKHIDSRTRTRSWRTVVSATAIFIGLLTAGYIYWQQTINSLNPIPENAITLELKDGTIRVLKEGGTTNVLNEMGKAIGKQDKNQLIYTKTEDNVEELAYNTLTVPYGKTFELQLFDGTKAHINAGSSLKYPVQFIRGMNRQVFVSGEAFLNVAKDTLHPFIVNTDNLNVRVLGTQFNIYAYPEDNVSEIVLAEGSVELYFYEDIYKEGTSTKLKPGFKASFDRTTKEITKEAVITNIYTSWMAGELVFRDMPFDNILKKLERHYDVTIINENKKLSQEKFNASFGKVSLYRVLENLRTYHGIEYIMHNNIITIK